MQREGSPQFTRRRLLAGWAALAGESTVRGMVGYRPPNSDTTSQRGSQRNLLAAVCSRTDWNTSLLARDQYHPFPTIADRSAWDALPPGTRAALVARGQKHLHGTWPEMSATVFLAYARTGDRTGYESLRSARIAALQDLLFAECVEGRGRFLDDITNGIWATCEESFWGVPAHLFLQTSPTALPDPQDPVVDIFAAQTSALLATADYLLNTTLDSVSPVIRKRINLEVERRVLVPLLAKNFSWMGLPAAGTQPPPVNNWNPWICWNWLTTSLLLEKDAARRSRSVQKAMSCLDVFINSYPEDGGCDEGPGYWNLAAGAMFDALELLRSATGGVVDIFSHPLIQQMALYINRAHIAGRYYINPGDASPLLQVDVDKVFRFGQRLGYQDLIALAVASIPATYTPETLPAIFHEAALRAQPPASAHLLRDVWLPETRLMAARINAGSASGLYLACLAANNGKSHNHNDTGSFWVYSEGLPILIDLGQQTYVKNSFGPRRYDIHSMQSAYHNLPTIGGVQQGVGSSYRATAITYQADDHAATLGMELATAYPSQAMLKSWRRSVALDRIQRSINIHDSYVLQGNIHEIVLNLMTPCHVEENGSGCLILRSLLGAPPATIRFDGSLLTPTVETIVLQDAELQRNWGAQVFRIQLKRTAPSLQGDIRMTIA